MGRWRHKWFPLALAVSLALLAGCGRRESRTARPSYDLGRSERLRVAGERLLSPGGAGWEGISEELRAVPESGELRQLLTAREKQEALCREAQKYLDEGRPNDLAALIDAAELRGEATPQLLQLRSMPQALQALRLFCSRQPYERAEDLEQSLNFLKPYVEELSEHAESFRRFHASQLALLGELRRKEEVRKVSAWLRRLDWALATAGREREAGECLRKIASEAPNAAFLKYINKALNGPGEALEQWLDQGAEWGRAAIPDDQLELALAVAWRSLSSDRREAAARALAKKTWEPTTLTGTAMRGWVLKSVPLCQAALSRWRAQATGRELQECAPSFLPSYLGLLLGERNGGRDGKRLDVWRHPVPGPGELLHQSLFLAR